MLLHMIGLYGAHAGQRFPLGAEPLSLGRAPDNSIQLRSQRAGRYHAVIQLESGRYMLHDKSSRNGTILNGERISAPTLLHPGDELALADEVFRFDSAQPELSQTHIPLPTGTVTFLFTDIEGSTPLWERHRTAMQRAMVRHDSLIEGAAMRHGGAVVRPRGEGDSRFVVFARASDAIAAACAMQRALAEELWLTPLPLRARIGIHTGEASLWQGDYYGPAVNRCARIRSLAHGGQTLLSLASMVLGRDNLPEGVVLRDMGWHTLRGLHRPEQVFQLLVPGLRADFPALACQLPWPALNRDTVLLEDDK